MNRDARISCRTTKGVRKGIEGFASKEGRSISAAIEVILTGFLRGRHVLKDNSEKRRYARRPLSIPALVKGADSVTSALESAVVLDISLGGMCISMPEEEKSLVGSEGGNTRFEAAFVLPDVQKPVRLLCKRERITASGGNLRIGASFVGGDFAYYQQLQQYLLP